MKIPFPLMLLLCIFIPVLVPYELNKVFIFNRLAEVLIVVFLFTRQTMTKQKVELSITCLILMFVALAAVSALFGEDFYKSIWGNFYRKDGIFTLIHLAIFSLIVSLSWKAKYFQKLANTVVIVNLVVCIYALTQFLVSPFEPSGSVFVQPNFLAGYLLVTLPPILLSSYKKSYLVGVILLQIVAIILSHSVAALLGVLLFLIGALWIQSKLSSGFVIASITIVLLLGVVLLPLVQKDTPSARIAESRERIYNKAIIAIKQKPLLGWGWANFDYAFQHIDWPIHYEDDVHVDKAHGHFLEIASTAGVITLTIYLILLGITAKSFAKPTFKERVIFLSLLLFVFHSQTNVISIGEEIFFWFYVGIAAISSQKQSTGSVKKEQ